MGTRGAMGFRLAGRDHIVYNGYDSDPGYLGRAILEALHRRGEAIGHDGLIGELKQRVRSLVGVDQTIPPTSENKAWCESLGLVNLDVATRSMDDWHCLLYGTQGNLEKLLEARFYQPREDFIGDSLFCEFAYIINLDDETLEFYTGFNKRNGHRSEGRYWDAVPKDELEPFIETGVDIDGKEFEWLNNYGPVALALTVSVSNLMSNGPDAVVGLMLST